MSAENLPPTMPVTLTNSEFFVGSMPITTHDVRARFAAWHHGDTVLSATEAVGSLSPSLGAAALASEVLDMVDYGFVGERSRLYGVADNLEAELCGVVQADMARTGLSGRITMRSFAGMYRRSVRDSDWHCDMLNSAIRWTVAAGVGSTESAHGSVTKSDFTMAGEFIPTYTVRQGGQLQPHSYPLGTVVRFISVGDVHTSPAGFGRRVLSQATLYLPN